MLKKGDIILVGIIVLGILMGFGWNRFNASNDTGNIAVIKQNDRVIKRINLDTINKPEKVEILGDYKEVVLVEKGRIRFEDADCPDKVCVKTGWLSNKGDIAVCLPNKAMIKIEGESERLDGVAY
ncbi:MAG: NusG domain II-containing protein [Clostridia bacterium]|nr:NusG domain II-containing protein [Clostridia bacterium]